MILPQTSCSRNGNRKTKTTTKLKIKTDHFQMYRTYYGISKPVNNEVKLWPKYSNNLCTCTKAFPSNGAIKLKQGCKFFTYISKGLFLPYLF